MMGIHSLIPYYGPASQALSKSHPNLFCFILPDPVHPETIDPTSNNDQTHDRLETLRPDELGLKLVTRFNLTRWAPFSIIMTPYKLAENTRISLGL